MMDNTITSSTVVGDYQIVRGTPLVRLIICDDDPVFLKKLGAMVQTIFDEMSIRVKLHMYTDVNSISKQMMVSCDMALLDIDYDNEQYNGIDIARKLRTYRKDAIIIFITDFIEYAPEGYEVQAFRYILKRELKSELEPYIHQAMEQLNISREMLKIQQNGEIIDLLIEEILYMEVQQHSVTVYVQKKAGKEIKTYSFYASLTELEKQLELQGFLRIHKSYLVNMRHISKMQCREALLDNGMTLRVGEKSYTANKRKYLLWKGWQK